MSDAPERPRVPCPRCGKGCLESDSYFKDLPRPERFDAVTVLRCAECRVYASQVPGVDNVWRDESPALFDTLCRDADDGIRQRRWLDAEPGDPGFRWGRI